MATNYVQPGKVLTLTAPYQRNTGQAAMIGSIFGVALATVANGAAGEFQVDGVWTLAKTAAQAWTVGDKIYWNAATKLVSNVATDGPLVGVAVAAAANPSSTGTVRLNGTVPAMMEGPQAAEADLTDNGGGAPADGTIGAVTAPTAIGATLTDSTGGSGTHDDTVADGLTPPVASAITATSPGTGADGTTWTGAQCTAAYNDLVAVKATLDQIITDLTVQNQNDSDIAQKVIELVTAQAEDRTAIVALTDAIKELSTKQNALLAKLRIAGIIAS